MDDPTPDLWRIAVDRTCLVPKRLKEFSQSSSEAARVHGMDEQCLSRLLDLGLHHCGHGTGLRFDDRDLTNIALLLGLPTPMRRTMRWWSQSLLRHGGGSTVRRTVHLTATCPVPGHTGECRYEMNPSLVRRVVPDSLRERRPGIYTFDIESPGADRFLGEEHREFVARMSAMEFHFVPPELTGDLGFAGATGLADCRLGARFARHLAAGMGFTVRQRFGYFLAGPYLLWHNWIELHDGGWFAADPFWLASLAKWRVPGTEHWPPTRSPQPLLWQPSDEQDRGGDDFYTMRHNGEPLRPNMMSTMDRA